MTLHLAILRAASILVPGRLRDQWLAEWTAELWYVSRATSRDQRQATAFCLGAFQDAFWMMRNGPRPDARTLFRLESGLRCVLFLAVVAAISVFFAFRLPGVLDTLLPSPYLDPRHLVMISPAGHARAASPTMGVEEYRSLAGRASHLFTGTAFYQPGTVSIDSRALSIARSSVNLFELLGGSISPPAPGQAGRQGGAALILSGAAWREHFSRDPHIVGRVLEVAGQQARVAGILSDDSWHLPGRVDAWLLDDAPWPAHSEGFMVARLPASNPSRRGQWSMSVPNGHGGYDRIECASLDRRQPILVHFLMIVLAIVVALAATSPAFGEYPAALRSPRWATRLRRWIFLAGKIALLSPVVFFGILDLAAISSSEIQTHGFLFGYFLAFWWALRDQRKRCPQCLRLLTNPTAIGRSSNTFLEWYGTEFMCVEGHGLLHVPEIPASGYSQQCWLSLDPSWSSLFSRTAGTRSKYSMPGP